jgi:hypothetical protein
VFAFVNVFAVFVHSGYTFQYGNEGILQVSWIVGDLSHGMGKIVHAVDNALKLSVRIHDGLDAPSNELQVPLHALYETTAVLWVDSLHHAFSQIASRD